MEPSTKAWKESWGIEDQRKKRYHPYYRIVKIGENIWKSNEDMSKLAVTQKTV